MFVDIAVLVVLLGSSLVAFLRGFIREILTIFGIVGGMAAAYVGGPLLIPTMENWLGVKEGEEPAKLYNTVPYDMIADVLAYGTVLVVFVVLLSFISHLISEAAKRLGLGPLDRTLGVIFGLARGMLVLGLIWIFPYSVASDEQKSEWFGDSKTSVYLDSTSSWMLGFLPEDAAGKLDEAATSNEKASAAREALKNMNLLGDKETEEENEKSIDLNQNEENLPINPAKNNQDGYSEEFRNQMNEIIENTTQEKPQ